VPAYPRQAGSQGVRVPYLTTLAPQYPVSGVGHDRFPNSIVWDTRAASLSGGNPFVAGELNLDSHGWAGYVPATRFTQR
jgi:hypothetical protein